MIPEWLKPILFVAGYVVLMRLLLPAMGVPTCMSGTCGVPRSGQKHVENTAQPPEEAEKV